MKSFTIYFILIFLLLIDNIFSQNTLISIDQNLEDNNKKVILSNKREKIKKNREKKHFALEKFSNFQNAVNQDSVYVEWKKQYYSNLTSPSDDFQAMALDDSGNIYVTGTSLNPFESGWDYLTVKYSSSGEQLWEARYNGPSFYDDVYDIAIDNWNNIIVTGTSYGLDTTEDCVTIKYNSSGEQLWVTRYNGQGGKMYDEAFAIATDDSGNIYITGSTAYYPPGDYYPYTDYLTIKYNSSGEIQWLATYDGPYNLRYDEASAIAIDDSGNVYVTGYSERDIATIKYNSSGEELWVARYNNPLNNEDWANAITIDDSGNVYITGSSGTESRSKYVTIKYSSNGEQQWVAMYNSDYNGAAEATAIALDKSNNIYVTGECETAQYNFDITTIKYNTSGETLWVNTHNGEGNRNDFGNDIVVDDSGNIYITGCSEVSDGSDDYITIKYDSDGQLQWVTGYDGAKKGDDEAIAIALDKSGNVIVGGTSIGQSASYDYAIIKYSSNGEQQYITYYNGPRFSHDKACAMANDDKWNLYVTGSSEGTFYDILIVKYTSTGEEQWSVRYNGPNDSTDVPSGICVDYAGNVYVTGYSKGYGTDFDFITLKYNYLGELQWTARYNSPENSTDMAYAIAVDDSGNIYVTGSSYSSNTYKDILTIKYNPSGQVQWINRYNGPVNIDDSPTDIKVDKNYNLYVTGESIGEHYNRDYVTIKYNPIGETLWVARYNSAANRDDYSSKIMVDDSGNVYVTGYTFGGATTNFDITTIKYNNKGEEQWIAVYNGPASKYDRPYDMVIDDSGNVYITGLCTATNNEYDYITIKYNSDGIEQWTKIYNSPNNQRDISCAIALDQSGNIYITGYSFNISTTIKYNTNGELKWIANDNSSSVAIKVDQLNNVYVFGNRQYNHGSVLTTIKYAQIISEIEEMTFSPLEFKLHQNYPNPFNPSTTIKFEIPKTTHVTLKIYNILGQEVAELVNEEMKPGVYNVNWNTSGFPSGTYFYRLKTTDFTYTKKIILLR